MHGTIYANYAVNEADLLLAFGVRFDDRVTGKVSEFAKHGKIVHIDIDPSEINKNKAAHIPIDSDCGTRCGYERNVVGQPPVPIGASKSGFSRSKHGESRAVHVRDRDDAHLAAVRHRTALADPQGRDQLDDTIVTTGVGQHQMWAAQYYKFNRAADLAHVGRSGRDGFRSARGDGRPRPHPDKLVIDIDGDGSFLMNIQELATAFTRKAAGQGAAPEQPAPGHGRAMGRPVPRRQPWPHVPRRRSRRGAVPGFSSRLPAGSAAARAG